MKDRFIRTVPPLSVGIIFGFIAISVALTVFAVYSVIKKADIMSFAFLAIMTVDLISSFVTTGKMLKNGVIFYGDRVEFTTVDSDNVYEYEDIAKTEIHKDTSASLSKRYTDRYTSIILHLKNGEVATVELGSTTKKKLAEIQSELDKRINGEV